MKEKITARAGHDAGTAGNSDAFEGAEAHGRYVVECLGSDGDLKWTDEIENLVTIAGKNLCLGTLMAGSAYTAAWYMGLIDGSTTPTPSTADTMASHAGWNENQAYSQATRPATAWNAAASGAIALSAALAFSINATATIAGCFLTTISTKGGTTGTLYSAGTFAAGNKTLQSGDTLNVSYTASM